MAFHEKEVPADASVAQKVLAWVDSRFPLTSSIKAHLTEYYAPKNLNFWYFFGSLAIVVLALQIVTGIFLVMNYKPDAAKAFDSVEYIMREVPWGWVIRYLHSTGASMFFVVVYMHMFRGLIYGSYRKPRELIWVFGCAIFLCLMGEAFFGYLLPWGQMSYWGAQVIVNLFSAIPLIGPDLSLWLRGDYVVGDATLNRFFAFHVIAIPLVLIGLVAAHIIALHEVGSNNPDGIEIKDNLDAQGHPVDGIPFHPYYTVHDVFGLGVFLMIFALIVFFAPEIAKKLKKCQFIFFDFQKHLTNILKERLEKKFQNEGLVINEYVKFIPFLDKENFYSLMQQSDLYLDTIGFSGFNTAIQAIECDLPIVTMDGEFMRGRLASGLLKRIGLNPLIAKSKDGYITFAIELACNKEKIKQIKAQIKVNKNFLFADMIPVQAFESFLLTRCN